MFRGSTPNGKPFTKDISYIKGFVLTYVKSIHEWQQDGIITEPKFVPPVFADFKGLAAWLSFGRFIGSLSFQQLEKDYSQLF